jgi:hypothetical protein
MLKSDKKDLICNYLTLLATKLIKYFLSLKISEYEWTRHSFASTEMNGLSLSEKEGLAEQRNNARRATSTAFGFELKRNNLT